METNTDPIKLCSCVKVTQSYGTISIHLKKSFVMSLIFRSQILNPDQMEAVRHIVADRTGYTPPFVIYGPFGTGKTETIAQAAMVLLKEKMETRILICAQSNR